MKLRSSANFSRKICQVGAVAAAAPRLQLNSLTDVGPGTAAILNRLTLHSESAHQMHAREIVFEPFDAQNQRDSGTEPILLRARKELLDPDSKW